MSVRRADTSSVIDESCPTPAPTERNARHWVSYVAVTPTGATPAPAGRCSRSWTPAIWATTPPADSDITSWSFDVADTTGWVTNWSCQSITGIVGVSPNVKCRGRRNSAHWWCRLRRVLQLLLLPIFVPIVHCSLLRRKERKKERKRIQSH